LQPSDRAVLEAFHTLEGTQNRILDDVFGVFSGTGVPRQTSATPSPKRRQGPLDEDPCG